MAKKKTKREFDWRTYSRPVRGLSSEQEAALCGGVLAPLLAWSKQRAGVRFEIRARAATLYLHGVSLARVRGEAPLIGEIDANLRVPRAERIAAERLEAREIVSADDAATFLADVTSLADALDTFATDEPVAPREHLTAFADANSDPLGELVVADIEYVYGKRRFDFVALRRAAAVGGAGAFTTPRLVLGELRYPGRPNTGASEMAGFGSDAAEFVHAISGEHLARAKAEIGDLIAQKLRLGLLDAEMPFARFTEDAPELLVVFSDPAFLEARYDAPIADLHDKLIARRFPVELLEFAATGTALGEDGLTLGEDDLMPYRGFKGMRKRIGA